MLLPFHILKYEHFLKSNSTDEAKTARMPDNLRNMADRFASCRLVEEKGAGLYTDMMNLIIDIAKHIVPKENPTGERIGDILGGKVLMLKSEQIQKEVEERYKEQIDNLKAQMEESKAESKAQIEKSEAENAELKAQMEESKARIEKSEAENAELKAQLNAILEKLKAVGL